jgi:hypothetical protein
VEEWRVWPSVPVPANTTVTRGGFRGRDRSSTSGIRSSRSTGGGWCIRGNVNWLSHAGNQTGSYYGAHYRSQDNIGVPR